VRYTVPAALSSPTGTFEVLFRSDQVYAPATVNVLADGKPIKTTKKRIITPGEMEKAVFTVEQPISALEINVENNT
jgi:hypothetical protein